MRQPTAVETLWVLGVVVFGTGCKPRLPEPAPVDVAHTVAPVKAAPKPVDLEPTDLQSVLCADRFPCQLQRIWSAGVDDEGHAMQVAKLSLKPKEKQAPEHVPEGFEEVTESHGQDGEPLEYWFVRPSTDAKPALLLAVFNDGYGMADMGIDTVTVSAGRFTHFQAGGSAWMWNTTYAVELPSLRIVEETHGSWHRALPESKISKWSWTETAGYTTGYDPACDDHTDFDRDVVDQGNFAFEPILQPSVSDAYRNTEWKSASLGSCSTRVQSVGNQQPGRFRSGFVIHGKPGAEDDASFKVVMGSDTEMFVELNDDVWVEEADSILHADHLELWATTGPECPRPLENLFQWGITLNGTVETLYGKPDESPTVEVVRVGDAKQSMRLKITLPERYLNTTLVYSDSDDGKRQKRLIATSAFKQRDPFTLGETKLIDAKEGRCELRNGALEFIRPNTPPRSPVLGTDSD